MWCVTGLVLARGPKGKIPIREAQSRPPDFPDPQTQGSIVLELESDDPRGPIVEEGACVRGVPWPSPGIIDTDLDASFSIIARGEAEYSFTKCGQLHAAPSVLERFSSSHLSPNTIAYDLLCGEGAATGPHTTDGHHRERLKQPDSRVEDPEKSEGVLALDDSHILFGSPGDLNRLGVAFTIADADAREVEPSGIEAHE